LIKNSTNIISQALNSDLIFWFFPVPKTQITTSWKADTGCKRKFAEGDEGHIHIGFEKVF
jgi:hypothetical protein